MQSMQPVIAGWEQHEVTFAKDQPEYNSLTVLKTEVAVMSRWQLTDTERAHIAAGGDLFIIQLHFGHPLQPICPVADTADFALHTMLENEKPL